MKTIFLLITLILSAQSFSDSFIRIENHATRHVQAIWQAGLCSGTVTDWAGDVQYTVCRVKDVEPGGDYRVDFSLLHFDRSMKVIDKEQGRIGYCNSMDDASITIVEDSFGFLSPKNNCPT